VLALLLVAVSLGLSNFAGAIGIGMSGVDARLRIRIGLVFAIFEAGMPALGLLLGHHLAHALGNGARPLGGGLLGLAGAYTVMRALFVRKDTVPETQTSFLQIVLAGSMLSIDNLIVGFALGTYHVNLAIAVAVIAAVSVALSLVGLELGSRLGTRIGQRSDLVGGAVLIFVGVAIGTGLF
jgi:putative Mn2+ efflux pump MntP